MGMLIYKLSRMFLPFVFAFLGPLALLAEIGKFFDEPGPDRPAVIAFDQVAANPTTQQWIQINDGFLDWPNHLIERRPSADPSKPGPAIYHVPYIGEQQRGWSIHKPGSASGHAILITLTQQQLKKNYPKQIERLDRDIPPGVSADIAPNGQITYDISAAPTPDVIKGMLTPSDATPPAEVVQTYKEAGFNRLYKVNIGVGPPKPEPASLAAAIFWGLTSAAGIACLISRRRRGEWLGRIGQDLAM